MHDDYNLQAHSIEVLELMQATGSYSIELNVGSKLADKYKNACKSDLVLEQYHTVYFDKTIH